MKPQIMDRVPLTRAGGARLLVAAVVWSLCWLTGTGQPIQAQQAAAAPQEQLSGARGLCVVVGEQAVTTALELARHTELLLYVQLADPQQLAAARQTVIDSGLYGTRIYVEGGPWERLFLAEDLADFLIATGSAARMPAAEALRVVRPGGRVWLGSAVLDKPIPAGVDAWSHPYHGPDNNPQSQDRLARGPYLTRFLAEPRYAPLPQVAVAAGGRVFKAFGHIAFKPREEPWLDTLAAFNGYNGTLLWKRDIPPALMVHRNTLIATPDVLYFGDDRSCKVIDAATGELRDEIAPPESLAGGTFWKWMALQDGVLYALIGPQEQRDPVIRLRRLGHGWPWDPLSPGYNQPEHTWGFGSTLLAIDPQTHQVLWHHQEQEPIDSRAVCMNGSQLFAFRFGSYLTCLDARSGRILWRKTPADDAALFSRLGSDANRQDWRTNWRTTAYLKCSEQALYFAGPQVTQLLALAADDGRVLWEDPYSNYQLVLREDGVYALSGQMGREVGMIGVHDPELSRQPVPSRVFDPLSGRILAEVDLGRRACTRPTGAIDAVFCRANGGSTRWDAASKQFGLVSPMRAQCHDGVTIANGLLYWWPSTCDCNLTLYGITCLGPAGDFDFSQPAREQDRLQRYAAADREIAASALTAADWPTFRANQACDATIDVSVPEQTQLLWRHSLPAGVTPTAPTAAGDLVFVAGSDGVVRALDAAAGQLRWTATTGGAVRMPPSIAAGRALAGSGDGWIYAWEAASGQPLWRFRAAPQERRIPVYGQLQSTWPVASGVVLADGIAYAAAGIVNYDGTHVYALDAATGQIKWQNNASGHLDPQARTGVSAQGQLLLHGGRLFLAGGNLVSPAVYDAADGRLLNDPASVQLRQNNNVPSSQGPRGCELYRIGDHVLVSGKPLYADPQYDVYDPSVERKILLTVSGDRELAWIHNSKLVGLARSSEDRSQRYLSLWNRPQLDQLQPLWTYDCPLSVAVAVGRNAAVLAAQDRLFAVSLADGRQLWACQLPAPALPWGLALNRHGQILVTLQNGELLCLGQKT